MADDDEETTWDRFQGTQHDRSRAGEVASLMNWGHDPTKC